MESLISIKESEFCEEFDSVDLLSTFLLDKSEAEKIWGKYIDKELKPYHQLESSHWLNATINNTIGNWIEAYNEDDYETVKVILESEINWLANDILYFCMSKYFVIKTTWMDFKAGWINFLMCEDESPVLINENNPENVLVFNPIGSIKRVSMFTLSE